MFSFCITLIVIFSIFLIILALLQNSKRDNSSGNIIGSMGANQLIGIKETTDILTKMTLFFIFAIFILSVFIKFSKEICIFMFGFGFVHFVLHFKHNGDYLVAAVVGFSVNVVAL